ncbi:MAG TPA: STAS domain-containing protein [Candidatus Acidoferrales bacterium]|nr:STAS domain-containing protein [Candidatus Acidoferrales bacterium]
MPSSVVVREVGAVTIVDFSGSLVLGESSALLRATLQELINKHRVQIILNLRDVSTIDSSGIGELVGAYAPLKTRGGEMKFLNPRERVHDVLKLTQLSKVFEVYGDEAEALRSFDS